MDIKYVLIIALMLVISTQSDAQMLSDPTIPFAGPLGGADQLYVVQNGLSKKTTVAALGLVAPGEVNPATYKLAGATDDTASIQAALATCQNVALSANTTYLVSSPMYLCNGGKQKIRGVGQSSVIKLASGFNEISTCVPGLTAHVVFANFNCNSNTIVDTNIEFEDLKIDGTAHAAGLAQLLAIFVRSAQYVNVTRVICDTAADCTAMVHDSDTTVLASTGVNISNSAFDHWDSPNNAKVIGSTAYCTAAGAFGITFNSANSAGTADGTGTNFVAVGNIEAGCPIPIFIDPLTTNGLIQNVNIIGNTIDGLGRTTGGISITGNVVGVNISQPVFRNIAAWGNATPIYVGPRLAVPTDTGKPTNVTITDPAFENVSHLVTLIGLHDSNTYRATGIRVSGGTYPYLVDVTDVNSSGNGQTKGMLIEGQLTAGSTGVVNTGLGAEFPEVINRNSTLPTLTSCGSGAAIAARSTARQGQVTPGTASITSCTINMPAVWSNFPQCNVTPTQSITGLNALVGGSFPAAIVLTIRSSGNMDSIPIYYSCWE